MLSFTGVLLIYFKFSLAITHLVFERSPMRTIRGKGYSLIMVGKATISFSLANCGYLARSTISIWQLPARYSLQMAFRLVQTSVVFGV